jgi:hypothetical protein
MLTTLGVLPAAAETLVPRASTWRYEASGTDLGTAWRDTAADDTGWPQGPGPLGYGDTYIATVVPYGPDPGDKHPTTYFRHRFPFAGPAGSLAALRLRVTYDDAFVAYLNGEEIARANLTGPVSYADFADASHEGGAYETLDVTASLDLLVSGENVLAVEAHQRSGSSSDLGMDAELLLIRQSPEVTRGPYLQQGHPGGVTVRWRTQSASDSRVRYGLSPQALSGSVLVPGSTAEHEVAVAGLSPDTQYYYAVGSSGGDLTEGPDYTFRTHPGPGTVRPIRAWIIGDSGTANQNADAVLHGFHEFIGGDPVDLWLMLGDNAYSSGTDSQYQSAVFDMYPEELRTLPLYSTRGNHDALHSGSFNDYYEIFTLPDSGQSGGLASFTEAYYSFDYGNVHFLCLDSQGTLPTPEGAMMTWAADDLAATTQNWVVAFWHHPPYSKGSHDSDDPGDSGGILEAMREDALPVLEQGGVDLVLCGHSHSYERSFLLDEHYGNSSTLHDSMKVDAGDGRFDGDGPYVKPTLGPAPHEGAVYVVAGSSGQVGGGSLDHPVMVHSAGQLGSLILDVDGDRLDGRFLDISGAVADSFTIIKGGVTGVPGDAPAAGPALHAPHPNPSSSGTSLAFTLDRPGPVRLFVVDVSGRRVAELLAADLDAGDHRATWNGTDGAGRAAAPGVYFAVLDHGGTLRAQRIVRGR